MPIKVSDLTVEELDDRIENAVRKVLHEEEILSDDFATEIKRRLANPVWISHEDVWKDE